MKRIVAPEAAGPPAVVAFGQQNCLLALEAEGALPFLALIEVAPVAPELPSLAPAFGQKVESESCMLMVA